ncbi:ribosome assembly cofactor RimP [Lutibacter sp.]|uniref:ribosome assembly cofactor RimP n=1 Tax=Lutibacter sp. TaxID=1925666 RepID=UPI0027365DC2|nr:ribosome assembly cofactor RimP [Lutibacter sp.]MDP3313418.1 ribosome assembly cofactor RimP [Lutibacter sp.]
MDKGKISELVNTAIAENPELYLIELSYLADNKIYVEVDGDYGVPLNECIRISRAVEHNLDREVEDFSLEVASPDVAKPLKVRRQYKKNINRTVTLKLLNNKVFEGILKSVTETGIDIEAKIREPKPIGKGKITVIKTTTVPFETIVEAKVKIIF